MKRIILGTGVVRKDATRHKRVRLTMNDKPLWQMASKVLGKKVRLVVEVL